MTHDAGRSESALDPAFWEPAEAGSVSGRGELPVKSESKRLIRAAGGKRAKTTATLELSCDRWKLRKKFAGFLSHYKVECAMEARHCQMLLEKALDAPFFIDSDDLADLRLLLDHVRHFDVSMRVVQCTSAELS